MIGEIWPGSRPRTSTRLNVWTCKRVSACIEPQFTVRLQIQRFSCLDVRAFERSHTQTFRHSNAYTSTRLEV